MRQCLVNAVAGKVVRYYEEHIIKGRPIGVRFECIAQTSPERSTLCDQR